MSELQQIILGVIRDRINEHPRSQQKRIGPSEIGHPCDRHIAYKLNDTPSNDGGRDRWRPTVGTAVHTWLSDTFEASEEKLRAVTGKPTWLVEQKVAIGEIYGPDGYEVLGGCDLFAVPWRTVVDWKIVGATTLKNARKTGEVGEQYRVQKHSYGRGWRRAGYEVDKVVVFFLPASGTLDEGVWIEEDYDESVCTAALERVSEIHKQVSEHGDDTPALMQPTEFKCGWCPWFLERSKNLAVGCPGVGVRESPLMKLVAPSRRDEV